MGQRLPSRGSNALVGLGLGSGPSGALAQDQPRATSRETFEPAKQLSEVDQISQGTRVHPAKAPLVRPPMMRAE